MSRRKRIRVVNVMAERMEQRLLLATNSWKTAVSGDWDTASNWSLGHVPLASEDVSITVAGSYTVTHSNTLDSDSCASITSDEPLVLSGGSLTVSGDIQVNNTFTISGGALNSATVLAGSGGQGITASGSGGTLSGVTLGANVSIPNNSTITFGGVTLNNDTVTIGSTGQQTGLVLASGSTVGGTGDITFAGSAPTDNNIFSINGAPVTLGKNITVNGSGGELNVNYLAPAFINQGTIDSSVSGQTIIINGEMDNQGTIEALSGGNINMTSDWTNEADAEMTVTGGGTLTLGPASVNATGANAGTISENNSTLNLGGTFTNTGTITRVGGTVNLTGLYNLSGGSRTLTSADGSYIMDGGGVENGTLSFSGSGTLVPTSTGGLLYSLTLDSGLTLANGDMVTTANLTMNTGAILTLDSTGSNTEVIIDGGTSIDGPGSIVFAGTSPADDILFAVNTSQVTFGASLTIDGEGGSFNINYETAAFINHGTINCDTANQTMTIGGPMDNFGIIEATDGGSVNMVSDWTNESGATMSVTDGGTLTIGPKGTNATGTNTGTITESDSTLNLGGLFTNTGNITRTAGTVNLIGTYNLAGGTLALNAATGPYVINGGGVENGTITFADGDRLVPTPNGGELTNTTLDSNIHITNNTNLSVGNGMTLNADIILRGATDPTTLYFDQNNYAAQTINGGGAVIFAGSNSSEDQISSLNAQGPVTFGHGITIEGNDGRLYLNYEEPAYVNDGIIEDDVAGGSLSLPANALTNNGVIEAAPGTITLDDAVSFSDSTGIFTVGIGGTVAGTSYGQIISTGGTLTLGGTLNTPLLPGFTPMAGQMFTPIKFLASTGSFSTENTVVGGGDAFTVTPASTSIGLTATTGGADFADVASGLLTVNGTPNADTISLSSQYDLKYANLNGTPAVFFSNQVSDELVNGNAGNDSITSSITNDTLIGYAGDDTIVTSAGHSTLQGAGGNDSIVGGGGNDSLRGGGFNDSLTGSGGNNVIVGGGGNDIITGGSGVNTLAGGPGNDSIVSNGTDLMISGIGTDTLDATNGTNDTIQYSSGTDSLIGDTLPGDSVVMV